MALTTRQTGRTLLDALLHTAGYLNAKACPETARLAALNLLAPSSKAMPPGRENP
jgi:hypothetical protein